MGERSHRSESSNLAVLSEKTEENDILRPTSPPPEIEGEELKEDF